MKINLIPTKKLALLSAVFCAAMLAFSQNASAVTNLTPGDGHSLGGTINESPLPSYSDADKAALINHLINQTRNTTDDSVSIGQQLYNVFRSNNDFGTLPATSVTGAVSGTGTNINIGSGTYSYLFATYSEPERPLIDGEVWYIGNLSGDITIPGTNLIGWTLFDPGGVPGVPDGGTTVMLLGTALGALGMARRFLKA
jgi:VPDSG-CTERM motif